MAASGKISRVLVANRGEIARRIIRSLPAARPRHGGGHSEAEARAAHVADSGRSRLAPSGGPRPQESLSRHRSHHRGRADAECCTPSIRAMASSRRTQAFRSCGGGDAGLDMDRSEPGDDRTMGDKQRARDVAIAARRSGRPRQPAASRRRPGQVLRLRRMRSAIRCWSRLRAGGGGIGMRRVDDRGELAARPRTRRSRWQPRRSATARSISSASSAGASCRSPGVRLSAMARPCISLSAIARSSGASRRSSRESPAPGFLPRCARRMADAAVALCRVTRYHGAGTIEFVVDADSLRLLLPGDEHADPGGARGHRDDYRMRPGRHADRACARALDPG